MARACSIVCSTISPAKKRGKISIQENYHHIFSSNHPCQGIPLVLHQLPPSACCSDISSYVASPPSKQFQTESPSASPKSAPSSMIQQKNFLIPSPKNNSCN
nr:hypothetical protein Iba_chr09bCG0580 [Ipomoea batatas]